MAGNPPRALSKWSHDHQCLKNVSFKHPLHQRITFNAVLQSFRDDQIRREWRSQLCDNFCNGAADGGVQTCASSKFNPNHDSQGKAPNDACRAIFLTTSEMFREDEIEGSTISCLKVPYFFFPHQDCRSLVLKVAETRVYRAIRLFPNFFVFWSGAICWKWTSLCWAIRKDLV